MKTRKILGAAILLACLGVSPDARSQTMNCEGLAGLNVDASSIALPTRGAEITEARIVVQTEGAQPITQHCLASGRIFSMDPHAPNIEFQVALPIAWNGNALMLGGGGFDGTIPDLTGATNNTIPDAPTPLARGYAVFGSNGGHRASPREPGYFMLNAEAYANYRGDAIKRTRDAAMIVIRAAYGRLPGRSYFVGGSSGGREALIAAGRWPRDWDGVVSKYPAIHLVTSVLGGQEMTRALAAPGAWLNPDERGALRQAALGACDRLDGLVDGLISNTRRCQATFNPRRASLNGAPLRCARGEDTGDTCLSDAQLRALDQINARVDFNFPLASGDTHHPGYNVYFQDNGVAGSDNMHRLVSWIAFGPVAPAFPVTPEMTLQSSYADNFFRYGVAGGDHAFNSLVIDPRNPGQYAAQLSVLSTSEADDRDLSGFAARGGKLILLQGTEDTITSPRLTEEYYEGVRRSLGARQVDEFLRFYEVAGWGHSFSTTFYVQWDYLTALENWVERGQDPGEEQIVADGLGVPGRTRPLCRYPAWPRYRGRGNPNDATSFVCATR